MPRQASAEYNKNVSGTHPAEMIATKLLIRNVSQDWLRKWNTQALKQ